MHGNHPSLDERDVKVQASAGTEPTLVFHINSTRTVLIGFALDLLA